MNFDDLAPEIQEKAKDCKTPEDILALAKAEGHELSDVELEAISGGEFWECEDRDQCPRKICRRN